MTVLKNTFHAYMVCFFLLQCMNALFVFECLWEAALAFGRYVYVCGMQACRYGFAVRSMPSNISGLVYLTPVDTYLIKHCRIFLQLIQFLFAVSSKASNLKCETWNRKFLNQVAAWLLYRSVFQGFQVFV